MTEAGSRRLRDALASYPLEALTPALLIASDDGAVHAAQHASIALALQCFTQALSNTTPTIKPSEMLGLLDRVRAVAEDLAALLQRVEQQPEADFLLGHFAKAQAYLRADARLQHAFGDGAPEKTIAELQRDLFAVADASEMAAGELSRSAARGELGAGKRSRAPGLIQFVEALREPWQAMTGREPSAARVERKGADSDDPPFVRFVHALCRAASLPPARQPTRSMIETALKP